ncbi:transmembrane channel-like protein 3 [Lingula anatina]|nr:transmembrane channel-like protein 3 [Lingula anatina]|eukprot:XP_013416134.1 transmembrane channel-like protein 3 [Lingula anatina]
MAHNARESKLVSKGDQYTFSWKLYSTWDFMIGNAETAHNKFAAIATSFREAIIEEEEKKKEDNRYLLIFLRILANIFVLAVLGASAYTVFLVVERSQHFEQKVKEQGPDSVNWWEANEVAIVMSLITLLFPSLFELIGMMEKYHPRVNLRWQLARILVLYLLNLYTLCFALFHKINFLKEQYADNVSSMQAANLTCFQKNESTFNTSCAEAAASQRVLLDTCWETMVGQEMVKLTVFDLLTTVGGILVIDFFRGLVVRYANFCCCWDLERKFPEYGEFKIAENVLHVIYNQGMIWMGTFFAPALPAVNILKLLILFYVRSWAVLVCNIPHERVFRASRSNNFYFFLVLVMLFLCTFPTGYAVVLIEPSPHCGPFSGHKYMYSVITDTIQQEFPDWLIMVFDYASSPGVIIPVFLLLIMIIYYLTSLSRSYKEANNDLKVQLHYERTEEKRKIYAMADAKAAKLPANKASTPNSKSADDTKVSPTVPGVNILRAVSPSAALGVSVNVLRGVTRQVQRPQMQDQGQEDGARGRARLQSLHLNEL